MSNVCPYDRFKEKTPVAWFEIIVKDLERSTRFYERVFEVQLKREDCSGIQMAIFPYQEGFPSGALACGECYAECQPGSSSTIVYLSAQAIEETLQRVEAEGGQRLVPCTDIGGGNGFIALFKDLEGNVVRLWAPVA